MGNIFGTVLGFIKEHKKGLAIGLGSLAAFGLVGGNLIKSEDPKCDYEEIEMEDEIDEENSEEGEETEA